MAGAYGSDASSGNNVHVRAENQDTKSTGEMTRNPTFINQLLKTEMCRRFRSGKCHAGKDCSYAHSKDELRSRPRLVKTKICPLGDKCRRGKDCTFAHSREELEATNAFFKTKMCAFGRSCLSGDKCRFRHSTDFRPSSEASTSWERTRDTVSVPARNSSQFASAHIEDTSYYSSPDLRLERALASPVYSESHNTLACADEQKSCLSSLDSPFEPLKIYTSPQSTRVGGCTAPSLRSV